MSRKLLIAFGVWGTGEAELRGDVCLSANDVHCVNDVRLTTDDVFASQRLLIKIPPIIAFGGEGTGEAGLCSEICLVADEIHFVDEIRLTTDDVFASQRLW